MFLTSSFVIASAYADERVQNGDLSVAEELLTKKEFGKNLFSFITKYERY